MRPSPPEQARRVAFYDFDGTLVSGNVVTRYAWFARRHPNRLQANWRYMKALLGVPLWLALDAASRRLFNIVFFRQYRGLEETWLRSQARELFETVIEREQFRFARERVSLDKEEGYRVVLVTGGLDFAMEPAGEHFGFDDILANRMAFRDGVATGEIVPPLLAGDEKATVLTQFAERHGFDMAAARAYSDSLSDMPMLESVGCPVATNPDARLRRAAAAKGWQTLDLDSSPIPVGSDSA